MQIYDCKVNHLTNPLGFRMTRTVFSWKVKDARGRHQTEARIQVAADENMTEILNDTGWCASLDSLASKVEVELKPVIRYYRTVSVRSDVSVKNFAASGEETAADTVVPTTGLSILLGNGWYKGRFGFRRRKSRLLGERVETDCRTSPVLRRWNQQNNRHR